MAYLNWNVSLSVKILKHAILSMHWALSNGGGSAGPLSDMTGGDAWPLSDLTGGDAWPLSDMTGGDVWHGNSHLSRALTFPARFPLPFTGMARSYPDSVTLDGPG